MALRRHLDLILPVFALLVGTVFFRLTDADISWTEPYCDAGEWLAGDKGIWAALYHFGTLPALVTTAAAIAILTAGFRSARLARHRRAAIFVILLMALGPGLVANALLKDNWGRPRPREVVELGGHERFEKILEFDPASKGKSFPCGHATMGFFFIGGYYIFRKRNRRLAIGLLIFGVLSGGAIGWARVVQGGHFPSDVLWAGGVIWLLAGLLARALRPEESPPADPAFRPAGWGSLAVAGLLIPALAFTALLATPIDARESRVLANSEQLILRIEASALTISPGDETRVDLRSHGFGLPGSGIRSTWVQEESDEGGKVARLSQRRSGILTEIVQQAEVCYNATRVTRIKIEMPSGDLTLRLAGPDAGTPQPGMPRRWEIAAGEGTIFIELFGTLADIDYAGQTLMDSEPETDRVVIRSARGGVRLNPTPRKSSKIGNSGD